MSEAQPNPLKMTLPELLAFVRSMEGKVAAEEDARPAQAMTKLKDLTRGESETEP